MPFHDKRPSAQSPKALLCPCARCKCTWLVLFHFMGITHLVPAYSTPAAAAAKIFKFCRLGFAQVFFLLGLLAAAAACIQLTGVGGVTQMPFF